MYQIGDRIQQAWLVDMQPTCVLLDRGGQEEALCFSNSEPVEKTRQHRTALQPVSPPAISGDLLSAVISIRYIFGFRKDNPNVFNSLIQSWPHF